VVPHDITTLAEPVLGHRLFSMRRLSSGGVQVRRRGRGLLEQIRPPVDRAE
jgi:hypothetical protein